MAPVIPSTTRETDPLLPTTSTWTSCQQQDADEYESSRSILPRHVFKIAQRAVFLFRFMAAFFHEIHKNLLRLLVCRARTTQQLPTHTSSTSRASTHCYGPPQLDPIKSGTDLPPPSEPVSSADFRCAVLSSFVSTPAQSALASIGDEHPAHAQRSRPPSPTYPAYSVYSEPTITPSPMYKPDLMFQPQYDEDIGGIETRSVSPSATPCTSTPSISTPSSSNSSFMLLRPALKNSSSSNYHWKWKTFSIFNENGSTMADLDISPLRKSVRFDPESDETHYFNYADYEEPYKVPTRGGTSSSSSSSLGKWKKKGKTIVWQDEYPREGSSHASSSRSQDINAEDDAYSRALFGTTLVGRILYSLLAGSRPPAFSSAVIVDGVVGGASRRFVGDMGAWSDEGKWREGGMY